MISSCLLGVRCRYDGRDSLCEALTQVASRFSFIPFCPEQLGGLPTPRPASNIFNGDGSDVLSGKGSVLNEQGVDVTENFIRGAMESLRLLELSGASIALMKDKSPSCGLSTPYCDRPEGFGAGVTAALFRQKGVAIIEFKRGDSLTAEELTGLLRKGDSYVRAGSY